MKVFKFGGASVKDASAVKNVSTILSLFEGQKLTVIVSAMGKTTNKLEEVVRALFSRNEALFLRLVKESQVFHREIIEGLFTEHKQEIIAEIDGIFEELRTQFNRELSDNFSLVYDQIVSLGEVISSKILSAYLLERGYSAAFADARNLIRTNNQFQEGNVDWKKSEELIRNSFLPNFEKVAIQVTQGFIGHSPEGLTTTLGREGSDYSAGIFAYCTNAESVTIWKDVPGMLNADPKWFDNTVKLDRISFKEAIELSYYGASVIHPKTIQPLQNKGISLYVKSFLDPTAEGTIIQASTENDHLVPSFIFKLNQVLFSFTTKDFSFIVANFVCILEDFDNLQRIYFFTIYKN